MVWAIKARVQVAAAKINELSVKWKILLIGNRREIELPYNKTFKIP